MKLSLCAFAILFYSFLQGQIISHHEYSNGNNAAVNYFEPTSNGYIIGGSRILAIDKDGDILEEINRSSVAGTDSYKANSFLVSEHTTGRKTRAYVAEYGKAGALTWEKYYSSGYWGNFVFDVTKDGNGNYIHAGRYASVTGSGATLSSINDTGINRWQVKFNVDPKLLTFCKKVNISTIDPTKLYVIGSANGDAKGNGLTRDYFISKHEVDSGKRIWTNLQNSDSLSVVTDLIELGPDSLLVIGYHSNDTSSSRARGFVSVLTNKKLVWTKHFKSNQTEHFYGIEKSSKGFLILGTRRDYAADSTRTFVKEINNQGAELSEYLFPNKTKHHIGIDVHQVSTSEYVVGGRYKEDENKLGYFFTKFDLNNLNDTAYETTDVQELINVAATVYPNPFSDLLHVENANYPLSIQVFNALGIEVFNKILDQPEPIHFESNSGVYFVKIMDFTQENAQMITVLKR